MTTHDHHSFCTPRKSIGGEGGEWTRVRSRGYRMKSLAISYKRITYRFKITHLSVLLICIHHITGVLRDCQLDGLNGWNWHDWNQVPMAQEQDQLLLPLALPALLLSLPLQPLFRWLSARCEVVSLSSQCRLNVVSPLVPLSGSWSLGGPFPALQG